MSTPAGVSRPSPVLIVVPVYRGADVTRACLESIAASDLPDDASVLIIDDAGPEEALREYCREFAARDRAELLVNADNLGFVASANRGLGHREDADVILLNSDTQVAGDWVQRLRDCAYREDNIGTVTPFSNNGTICSYPVFLDSNPLPPGFDTAGLDALFRSANAQAHADIPTGVGFCLYIRRACLDATGMFDVDRFGQGYGEECDFCLRASARGWRHVAAADVFVYHEGGASFAGESEQRKLDADRVIGELHPQYHELVEAFIQRDPLMDYRLAVDAARLAREPGQAGQVLAEHARYARLLAERVEEYRRAVSEERSRILQLERMLQDCRTRFEEIDSALGDARSAAERLSADIRQQATEIENGRIYARSLLDHIHNMEQSRSWRYTAWLRRRAK